MDIKMYSKLSKYYDLMYQGYEYETRATVIAGKILQHNPNARSLLDVACGTANYAAEFSKLGFNVTGLDASKDMLKLARKKCKSNFILGDMRKFKLDRKFDAITCMFNSILYNKNHSELKKTLGNFKSHLNRKGVLVFDFVDKSIGTVPNDWYYEEKSGNVSLKWLGTWVYEKKSNSLNINNFFIVDDNNKHLAEFDFHKMGAFSKAEILKMLHDLGFKVEITKCSFEKTPPESEMTYLVVAKQG